MPRTHRIEKGIFRWIGSNGKPSGPLWVHVTCGNKVIHRTTKTLSIQEARRFRAKLQAEALTAGAVVPARLTVGALLDDLVQSYARNEKASLRTIQGHVKRLQAALGLVRVNHPEITSKIEAAQDAWIRDGIEKVTINRYCETLRVALRNWAKKNLRPVPWVPMLDAPSGRRAKFISEADQARMQEHLPDHLRELMEIASIYGIRKGQLARTLRTYVIPELRAIEWPPHACKSRSPHTLPLEDRGWGIVAGRLVDPPAWCPYLFHGEYCSPIRKPSKAYGCIGDFKRAWRTAVAAAGLLDVRFHDTRRTAATQMRAAGMEEADAMKITGHQTTHMFRHYDLGNLEALRAKVAGVTK